MTRDALRLGLMGLGLLAAWAAVASPKPARVVIAGRQYQRLDDWARSAQWQVRWPVPGEQVKLTGPAGTLVFWKDSRRCLVNGISVWLSAPIAVGPGAAYIAPLDLTTAIQPLLTPARQPPGQRVRTICLDPGHGGRDPGNREGRFYEKRFTLAFAQELRDQLRPAGFRVVLTRSTDSFVELDARAAAARRSGADLFLSLHFNAADGPGAASVRGVEVYCLTPAGASSTNVRSPAADTGAAPGNRFDARNVLLAYQVQKALVARLGAEDRGVRRARFGVLRAAEMPAVLIEGGFMSHPGEFRKIADPAHRRSLAQAVLAGIQAYKTLVER